MDDYQKVAKWLYDKIAEGDYVYQEQVVYEIANEFGDKFTYPNENGNPAIDKKVLKEFGKLKNGKIIWDRSERCWHMRTDLDDKQDRLNRELSGMVADLPEIEPIEIDIEPINIDELLGDSDSKPKGK